MQVGSLSRQLREEKSGSRGMVAKVQQLERAVSDLSKQEAASGNELRTQCGAAEARSRCLDLLNCACCFDAGKMLQFDVACWQYHSWKHELGHSCACSL